MNISLLLVRKSLERPGESEECSVDTHRFEPVLQSELLSLVILEQSLSDLK
jgi:hypothetical protein